MRWCIVDSRIYNDFFHDKQWLYLLKFSAQLTEKGGAWPYSRCGAIHRIQINFHLSTAVDLYTTISL